MTSSTPALPRHGLRAGLVVLGLAAMTLTGCAGKHGKYTTEHKNQAQEKMSMLKSGTEWQMAHQQFLAGDIDKALKTVNRSIAINPNVPKSHVLKGRILIEKGRLEEARASLLEAEKLDAKNVEAQYYLGIVHEQFSQPAEALVRYQAAAELDTANPQYVVAAAEMLTQQGRVDEAEQYIQARRQNFEYNPAIRQALGHIAMLRNDPKTAAERFNEALLLAPDDDAILEDVAQAQMAAGNYAEAEFAVSRLLERDAFKDRRDLRLMRVKCLMSLNRPVEARSILLEMTGDKESGRDQQVWIDLGNCAAVLKDKPHLRLAAMRVVALAPDRHEGYTLRALYSRMEGRPEEALTQLDEAVQRCGADPTPFILRALVLQDLGRPFEARQTIETALNRNPSSQRLHAMLAALDSQTGGSRVTSGEQHNQP